MAYISNAEDSQKTAHVGDGTMKRSARCGSRARNCVRWKTSSGWTVALVASAGRP